MCLGRHTITGMLTAGGRQFEDWSADYRLFSRERFDPTGLFQVCRREVAAKLPAQMPFIASMDDTLLRKTGGHRFDSGKKRGLSFLDTAECRDRAFRVEYQNLDHETGGFAKQNAEASQKGPWQSRQ